MSLIEWGPTQRRAEKREEKAGRYYLMQEQRTTGEDMSVIVIA